VGKGLVIKSTGSWYIVLDNNMEIPCRIKGKFRLKNLKTTNPVTVGDKVEYVLNDDNTGLIINIEDRKNYIIRKSTSFSKEAQLLAANIDLAFLMVSLKFPATPFEFIDRFLVTAEAYHIQSIILINKIDILSNVDLILKDNFIKTYTLAGYKCVPISVINDFNITEVTNLLKNKISLVAGNSGVGKTSLINHLSPSLNLKTAEISNYHKTGKHTTTFAELFCIDTNTYIIDSPGIRGFGLIDFEKSEIGLFFPEIFRISKNCKFYNCTHSHEPGCAVLQAIDLNQIALSRYRSYLNILNDKDEKYRS
jgi:ribosome biogenesis GTPase / thiamine phosphate phosphatase